MPETFTRWDAAEHLNTSVLRRLPHPGRHVTRSVKDAPDIDFRLLLDIENQIGKLPNGSETQAGKVQFVSIARRARRRVLADMTEADFYRVNEGQRARRSGPGQIILDRRIDIAPSSLAKDDRFAAHCSLASCTCQRRCSK